MKDFQAPGEAFKSNGRMSSSSNHEISFFLSFLFCGFFGLSWFGSTDPQLNPHYWIRSETYIDTGHIYKLKVTFTFSSGAVLVRTSVCSVYTMPLASSSSQPSVSKKNLFLKEKNAGNRRCGSGSAPFWEAGSVSASEWKPDQDPHQSQKADPDPDPYQSERLAKGKQRWRECRVRLHYTTHRHHISTV